MMITVVHIVYALRRDIYNTFRIYTQWYEHVMHTLLLSIAWLRVRPSAEDVGKRSTSGLLLRWRATALSHQREAAQEGNLTLSTCCSVLLIWLLADSVDPDLLSSLAG